MMDEVLKENGLQEQMETNQQCVDFHQKYRGSFFVMIRFELSIVIRFRVCQKINNKGVVIKGLVGVVIDWVQSLLKLNIFLPILMEISNQFIDQLLNHQHFKSCFISFWSSFQAQTEVGMSVADTFQIQSVVEEISQVLQTSFKNVIQEQCNHIYESNRHILQQLQLVKGQLKVSSNLKTQSSTAERDTNPKLQTSIFFQTDSQYDIKQLRHHFDESIENKVLINSFEIDQQEKTYIDQQIEDKINASIEGSINRIELTLEEKFDKYSAKIQQRIEQLRKTIASVVQAMNQKQVWDKQIPKTTTNSSNNIAQNAFCKKQTKPKQNQNPNLKHTQKPTQKPNEVKVKNSQTQKSQIQQNAHANSNKAMQTLNKSINLGRTRIKSLFGFKSTTTKQQNTE